jgi:hypothetical protein
LHDDRQIANGSSHVISSVLRFGMLAHWLWSI